MRIPRADRQSCFHYIGVMRIPRADRQSSFAKVIHLMNNQVAIIRSVGLIKTQLYLPYRPQRHLKNPGPSVLINKSRELANCVLLCWGLSIHDPDNGISHLMGGRMYV